MKGLFPAEELVNAKANFPHLTACMKADEYIDDKYIFQREENINVYIFYRVFFHWAVDSMCKKKKNSESVSFVFMSQKQNVSWQHRLIHSSLILDKIHIHGLNGSSEQDIKIVVSVFNSGKQEIIIIPDLWLNPKAW